VRGCPAFGGERSPYDTSGMWLRPCAHLRDESVIFGLLIVTSCGTVHERRADGTDSTVVLLLISMCALALAGAANQPSGQHFRSFSLVTTFAILPDSDSLKKRTSVHRIIPTSQQPEQIPPSALPTSHVFRSLTHKPPSYHPGEPRGNAMVARR
jgi:hypothetical protein